MPLSAEPHAIAAYKIVKEKVYITKTTFQNHPGGYLSGFTKFNVYNTWFYSSEGYVDHNQ